MADYFLRSKMMDYSKKQAEIYPKKKVSDTVIPNRGPFHRIQYTSGGTPVGGLFKEIARPSTVTFEVPMFSGHGSLAPTANVAMPYDSVRVIKPSKSIESLGYYLKPWIEKSKEFMSSDETPNIWKMTEWLAKYIKEQMTQQAYLKGKQGI
jgi:hypothetical protein